MQGPPFCSAPLLNSHRGETSAGRGAPRAGRAGLPRAPPAVRGTRPWGRKGSGERLHPAGDDPSGAPGALAGDGWMDGCMHACMVCHHCLLLRFESQRFSFDFQTSLCLKDFGNFHTFYQFPDITNLVAKFRNYTWNFPSLFHNCLIDFCSLELCSFKLTLRFQETEVNHSFGFLNCSFGPFWACDIPSCCCQCFS